MTGPSTARPRRAAAALGALVVALSAVVTAAPVAPVAAQEVTPTPTPTSSPSGSPWVTHRLTHADAGRTVVVRAYDLVVVELEPQRPGDVWRAPGTTGPVHLASYAEAAERSRFTLQPVRTSTAPVRVQAVTDARCAHLAEPCAYAPQRWHVDVQVEPGGERRLLSRPCVTRSPHPDPARTLRAGDSGRTVVYERGTGFVVDLSTCGGDPWTPPAAAPGLFRTSSSDGYSTYDAVRPGRAVLTSTTDPACFAEATPCARPSARWQVEVDVREPGACAAVVPTVRVPAVVEAAQPARVEVVDPVAGTLELVATTRPGTQPRVVRRVDHPGGSAPVVWEVRPPGTTRLLVRRTGACPATSAEHVLAVRTAVTIDAVRRGPRDYAFTGRTMPVKPGRPVALHRVEADGREVLTSRTRVAGNGTWRVERRFTGSGRFGFVARTGQDDVNAPGRSRVRPTLVH